MKKITCNLLLLACLAGAFLARAQTNAAAPGQPVDNTNLVADAPLTNTVLPAVATNTVLPVTATNTMPATNAMVAAVDTNTATAAVDTNTVPPALAVPPTTPMTDSNAVTTAAPENIPLIQFSDVPITTAIEHLARQAGINYMLDPRIGYGQPDQNGQIKAEPQLSIRWENITAASALLALLDNYGLQLVVDKKTGIDRIMMKDPAAPPTLITRVVQLQYAGVSNMVDAAQSVLTDKRSRVLADVRTSQLLVVATDPEQTSIDTLIAQLDKPTRQVLIETKLIEISSNPTAKRGVDWSSTLAAQNVTFGNGQIVPSANQSSTVVTEPGPTGTTTVTTPGGGHTTTVQHPSQFAQNTILTLLQGTGAWTASTKGGLIPATAFLNADGVNAVISFLNASYDAQIYSTPRVVTLDNETAHIEVIRALPIIGLSGSSANQAGSASVTYSNVGTILDVTPRISANDTIWLRVVPEVSDLFANETVTVPSAGGAAGSFQVPIFDRRKIDSQVTIPNGNTLVMGGLVQDSPNATYSKVPFLGDIPGLGWAFHSESKSLSKDNLIIFLTPTIVRDADYQPTVSTFLQSKPKTMRAPMDPHTPWDGAEPESGWNNPAPIPGEFDNSKNTR
jgi:type II secretory pathway component GspD/PulD (secretin)